MEQTERNVLPYTDFTVGGKNYMLRLTARSAVRLEERLGCSVYEGAKRLTEMKVVIDFLFALIESLSPEITKNAVYLLYDEYITEGGTLRRLNEIIAEALGRSGFFDEGADGTNDPHGADSPPRN